MADFRTITIGARTQYVVKVSPEDYDWLMQWKWTYAVSHKNGGLVYARRAIRSGSSIITILMHREIIEKRMQLPRPSDNHFVDHENDDALDNRRVNDKGLRQLQWLTARDNNLKKLRRPSVIAVPTRRALPIAPAIPSNAGLEDIPY